MIKWFNSMMVMFEKRVFPIRKRILSNKIFLVEQQSRDKWNG